MGFCLVVRGEGDREGLGSVDASAMGVRGGSAGGCAAMGSGTGVGGDGH